jgi:hypothetical protein
MDALIMPAPCSSSLFGSPWLHHFGETPFVFGTCVPTEKLPASIAVRPDVNKKAPVTATIFPANDGLLSNDQTYGGEITCLTRVAPRH